MANHCEYTHCWMGMAAMGIVWWLVAAALLWLTWNRVIVPLAKAKPAKYWQALLILLATYVLLDVPMMMRHQFRHHMMTMHGEGSCCHHEGGAPCPYEHDKAAADGAGAPASTTPADAAPTSEAKHKKH